MQINETDASVMLVLLDDARRDLGLTNMESDLCRRLLSSFPNLNKYGEFNLLKDASNE